MANVARLGELSWDGKIVRQRKDRVQKSANLKTSQVEELRMYYASNIEDAKVLAGC
jgi:hypothetical protein